MTQQVVVVIANALSPESIRIKVGDLVIWQNNTADVQTASSDDGGESFTTGPIQENADSMPIAVPQTTTYTVSPAGFHGNITVD
jgi:plastocyanin